MTALRFQTGGDIRHPRPPFGRERERERESKPNRNTCKALSSGAYTIARNITWLETLSDVASSHDRKRNGGWRYDTSILAFPRKVKMLLKYWTFSFRQDSYRGILWKRDLVPMENSNERTDRQDRQLRKIRRNK